MGGLVEWRCGHLPPLWNIPYAFSNNIINSKRFRDIMDQKTRHETIKWIREVRSMMINQFKHYWDLMDALDSLELKLNE
jgi:hypothetical protein